MATYHHARSELPELLVQVSPPVEETAGASPPLWRAIALGERVAAAALLVVLFPLLACAGIVILALSRRSPLVAHQRVRQGGTTFWVLKLRTMWGCPETGNGRSHFFVERLHTEPVKEIKKPDDPRITSRFAAFCRKHSIDELPQLWHVVEGTMSLVGPRPMTVQELADYYGQAAAEVLACKPGLTGLWQIRGRSRLSYPQRRRLDLFLVRKRSPWLYLKILLATIPRVLAPDDAW